MPSVPDLSDVYSETGAGHLSPTVKDDLERVYVPNRQSNDVTVIDPETLRVVDHYKVGINPQHIVPSWDLKTLWVANNAEGRRDGSLTPIDPKTGKPGPSIPVDDPYNMYFMPDGSAAIIVAEEHRRLDLRDPQTLELKTSIDVPQCGGINHADFSIDGRYAIFTCEFTGGLSKIDLVHQTVEGYLTLRKPLLGKAARGPTVVVGGEICSTRRGMPQDIRVSPDGKIFYVADMEADGVFLVDGDTFAQIGFIPTGTGTHGLYPSRDGKALYVANRGSHQIHGLPRGPGSISVISFASRSVVKNWPIPGGGSPDMGNVSANGAFLWLSGRFDNVVYRIDTSTGAVDSVAVGTEPHGLTVWPQPGRYSLGHTGNLR
ncbi:MAG: YncE family protein [Burkholderiaceae bacterium]|jgi:YVTN family beta-propeller protein